jgi:hypothetical protein
MRSTHREMRCSAAVQAARYSGREARRPLRNPAGRKRDIATVEAFIAFSIGPIQTARYLSNQTSSSRKLLMMLLTIIVQFLT